jgi:hypothetical protein
VLRRIFGSKKDEIAGDWRKLELQNLYSSTNIIEMIKKRRIKLVGPVTLMGEKMNAHNVLVGSPEGKRSA